MKILVISDTHRQINKATTVLHSIPDITTVIHIGDMVGDAEGFQPVLYAIGKNGILVLRRISRAERQMRVDVQVVVNHKTHDK